MREQPAEVPGGRRAALVVATSVYSDPTLAKLRAPGEDARQLAEVLADVRIGRFEVEVLVDEPVDSVRRRIAQFCARGRADDLALVYLSCHGVLDDRGRLYYAATDTERELLSVTAVPAAWLTEHLEDCRCRQQILVLDCCHSGAFARGAKGSGDLSLRERVEGRGRVVLTASRATEYSFEGHHVIGSGASSVFTSALVRGLERGEADSDGDGRITVNELYDYAYSAVKATDARQNPSIWSYGAEGSLLIAHSPRGAAVKPVPLPEHLAAALESPGPHVRVGAVAELAELLAGSEPGRAMTARQRLEHIATQDIPLVAQRARSALNAHAEPPVLDGPAKQEDVQLMHRRSVPVPETKPAESAPAGRQRDERTRREAPSPASHRAERSWLRLRALALAVVTFLAIALVGWASYYGATNGHGLTPEEWAVALASVAIALAAGTRLRRLVKAAKRAHADRARS